MPLAVTLSRSNVLEGVGHYRGVKSGPTISEVIEEQFREQVTRFD